MHARKFDTMLYFLPPHYREPGFEASSPYAVLKHWLVEGPTLEAKGDRKTLSKILFPHGAIDISVYLKKSSVHAILSSSGAMAA